MYVMSIVQIMLFRLTRNEAGAVATEYAFLIAFISIVAAIGMVLLGDNLSAFFTDIGIALDGAGENIPPLPGGS